MSTHSFRLTKWYLDVIDTSGRGMIGYQADLAWGRVTLSYDGIIPIGDAGFKAKGNFTSKSAITQSNGTLSWSGGSSTGTWQQLSPSVEQDLLDTKAGLIRWQCLQPSSLVAVNVDKVALRGVGYAEKIEITLPPWRLPIQELFWGRYVSKQHSIVWIRWIGAEPRVILFMDGRPAQQVNVTSTHVLFASYRIELPRALVRNGTLGETLFAGAGKLAGLFPKSILALQEVKWYGNAVLSQNGTQIDEGNVIHETVRWP